MSATTRRHRLPDIAHLAACDDGLLVRRLMHAQRDGGDRPVRRGRDFGRGEHARPPGMGARAFGVDGPVRPCASALRTSAACSMPSRCRSPTKLAAAAQQAWSSTRGTGVPTTGR